MLNLNRRNALKGIAGLAGTSVLAGFGCAVNPVTGKRELMLMTEQQEITMGAKAHNDIVGSYGSYCDTTMQTWFNDRGQEMTKVTHRPNLTYSFTVLDSPVINAFAVPGGYVYVTRGILAYFNDEAQFAGVLAHELGHVNARHTAARYSKAQLANIGLGIGTIFSEEFQKYSQLVSLGTTLLFLKFSRNDEREADKLGVSYSSKVGYDAVQMSKFFNTLERMHPKGGSLPSWQSTHPDPGDRIAATKKMAKTFQKAHPKKKFTIRKNEYLDLVDGIVFGDDPRQGYVKDDIFYHPEMKFQFPVPSGWNITNKPSEVRMAPEKQGSMMIFTSADGSSPSDAALKFATSNNIEVTQTNNITVNDMPGVKTAGELADGETKLAVFSYYIQLEKTIFSFHGLSGVEGADTAAPVFQTTAMGFNRLNDTERIQVAPEKIEVRTIKGSKTALEALKTFGIPDDQHEKLVVLNGVELSESLPDGFRIKIVS